MGVTGVVLIGIGMFIAYLDSQGKLQKIWDDAFGSGTTASNATDVTVPAATATSPATGTNTLSITPVPSTPATPSSPLLTIPSLSYPQLSLPA